MLNDLQKCIDELLDCNAFELQLHTDESGRTDCYIPYMMNDALECYFVLKDCKITGTCVTGILENHDAPGDSNDFGNFACAKKLSAKILEKELKCYRYHEIGHFWVSGQEHYRRLVYMIGTIYDKFEYMGESICNEEELSLLPLMEFAPFRYWSPIHESLDAHYPDTLDGFASFKELCMEAGDTKLLQLVQRYEKIACGSFLITDFYRKLTFPRLVKRIAHELIEAEHDQLYELIHQKVCEASSKYPSRDYGDVMNRRIADSREKITEALLLKGFTGTYPRFSKKNKTVLVAEEHPFTHSILEYENYGFRMQFMLSEKGKSPRIRIVKEIDEI